MTALATLPVSAAAADSAPALSSASGVKLKDVRTFKLKDALFLQIVADNGVTGWGEASPNNRHVVETFIHTGLKKHVIGRSVWDAEPIWDDMFFAALAQACSKPIIAHNTKPTFSAAVALHFMASISNAGPFIEFIDVDEFKDLLILMRTNVDFRDGSLHVPQGPGLGIDVDETAVKRAVVS